MNARQKAKKLKKELEFIKNMPLQTVEIIQPTTKTYRVAEEAIKQLKIELSKWESECKSYHKTKEALDIAIKFLEQGFCEDAISRQAMLEYQHCLYGKMPNGENYKLWKFITELPSVTPTTKWTPVSESFPKEHIYDDGYVEPSETVLVQLNNGEMKTSRYWGSRESRKDEPWIDLSYPTTLEVVAWRPLPNKYSTPHDSRCKNGGVE